MQNFQWYFSDSDPIPYILIPSKRKTMAMEIKDGNLFVRVPVKVKAESIDKFIKEHLSWIKKNLTESIRKTEIAKMNPPFSKEERRKLIASARSYMMPIITEYAERIGVTFQSVSFRIESSKWGSCTASGKLNFNALLMYTPDDVMRSVVCHELCHRKHMDHSADFYRDLAATFPSYKECDKWLSENGSILLYRASSLKETEN